MISILTLSCSDNLIIRRTEKYCNQHYRLNNQMAGSSVSQLDALSGAIYLIIQMRLNSYAISI